ncbi:hypothetical protein [Lysobacter auxotrophicus]|uniref:hypothetical protein n=1 Tax=Lysobacter auxotrophicus TaxID=2992573 RepID=UPI00248F9C7D|nr:hypothetical protein [Lysobacter auxotrophicus]
MKAADNGESELTGTRRYYHTRPYGKRLMRALECLVSRQAPAHRRDPTQHTFYTYRRTAAGALS